MVGLLIKKPINTIKARMEEKTSDLEMERTI
jgi:hypothetical protein